MTVSHKPRVRPSVAFITDAKALLKGGGALGVVGASLLDGSVAEARSKAQKEQAEALKAAAAARAAVSQPGFEQSGDYYARAKLLLAGGDVPGAMSAFRRVLVEEPRSVDAMNGLGVTYDRMGRHDVARGWYEAALAVAPQDGAVLANLGYSLTLQNEWREAIPWLQAAARSADPAAVQTARRLLARASAVLTAERARAPVLARPVEVALSVPALEALPTARPAPQASSTLLAQMAPPAIVTAPPLAALRQIVPETTASQRAASQRPASPTTTQQMAPQQTTSGSGSHIEFAANGEARLVMGNTPRAAAVAPELVASLGDAATLVLAARARVPLAPALSAPQIAPQGNAEVMLASAEPAPSSPAPRRAHNAVASVPMPVLVMVEAPIAVLTLASTPEITLIPALVAARAQHDALADAAGPATTPDTSTPSFDRPAIARPVVRQALARVEAAKAAAASESGPTESGPVDVMRFALAPESLTRTSVAVAPILTAARPQIGPQIGPQVGFGGAVLQRSGNSEANPAWLLHIRRTGYDGRTVPSTPALVLTSADAMGSRLFDSDDGALNTFAARLRAPKAPGDDQRSLAARQAAIARLEAVIARVRAV
jgi:Flp pilus assembly protein TadD